MTAPDDLIFLLDVDDTLLDGDRIERDLRRHLDYSFGAERSVLYWDIFEKLRTELGYADYLGALQQYCLRPRCSWWTTRSPIDCIPAPST